MHHAFCYNLESKDVKMAHHIAFDEGMHESPDLPLFAKLFNGELDPSALNLNQASSSMGISMFLFNEIKTV